MFYTEHDFQVDLKNLRGQLEISCRENTTLLPKSARKFYFPLPIVKVYFFEFCLGKETQTIRHPLFFMFKFIW